MVLIYCSQNLFNWIIISLCNICILPSFGFPWKSQSFLISFPIFLNNLSDLLKFLWCNDFFQDSRRFLKTEEKTLDSCIQDIFTYLPNYLTFSPIEFFSGNHLLKIQTLTNKTFSPKEFFSGNHLLKIQTLIS